MFVGKRKKSPFVSAHEEVAATRPCDDTPQCRSASYRLAFQDPDLLLRDELRPVRLQLEVLKPELILQEQRWLQFSRRSLPRVRQRPDT